MLSIIHHRGYYLISDSIRGIYKLASATLPDARATLPRARVAPKRDFLDPSSVNRALSITLRASTQILDWN